MRAFLQLLTDIRFKFSQNKKMKRIFTFFMLIASLFSVSSISFAQEMRAVEYPAGYAADVDLDGLTDEGEKQLFLTDPNNPDTDWDGYFDGLEILNGTNPLDVNSYLNPREVTGVSMENSWAWYITRATALISFALLYIVVFFGLTVRLPFLNKIFSPLASLRVHAWLSVQALAFAAVHGISLVFDKFLKFTIADVFIPFSSYFETNMVALGVISFYVMLLLILTSYFRRLMSHKIWRISHFLNIALYVIVIIHALNLGTDLKSGTGRDIFIWSNFFLGMLFVANLSYQLIMVIKRNVAARKIDNLQN